MTDRLLTTVEAGKLLSLTNGALAQMRYLGKGPRFVKLGRHRVRYRETDLDDWITASIRTPA